MWLVIGGKQFQQSKAEADTIDTWYKDELAKTDCYTGLYILRTKLSNKTEVELISVGDKKQVNKKMRENRTRKPDSESGSDLIMELSA